MARIAKKTVTKSTTENLFEVDERLGCIFIDNVIIKENVNGKRFVSTPYGAMYLKVDDVKPKTIYMVVKFKSGSLGLNTPDILEKLAYYTGIAKNLGISVTEVKAAFGAQ